MNILLVAYACEPNKGSEPEVGWKMSNAIAINRPNDTVHVITKANNKESIELDEYPTNITFHYYAPPKWITFWKKGGRGIRTYYYLWMIGGVLHMKSTKISFDLIHHITFVNDWLPSFFTLLKTKNNKFIWGPIGSHDPIEMKFLEGAKRQYTERFRIMLQLFMRNIDPFFHYCKAKSDCIIGINENVYKKLKLNHKHHFIAEPAIGLNKEMVEVVNHTPQDKDSFLIISVGRLLYIKNFKLTIHAFAVFLKNNPSIDNARLQIIGDGGDRKQLEHLVQILKIDKYVEFTGNIPLREVQTRLSQANLFLFPTLENAGFVILEAMSHSLPVVAMEYGGPQQFVKNNISDQLVSSNISYDEITKLLAEKLTYFYDNKERCIRIGQQNKQDIIDHFTWEQKAKKMNLIYEELFNEN